jgi:hypothetical protein
MVEWRPNTADFDRDFDFEFDPDAECPTARRALDTVSVLFYPFRPRCGGQRLRQRRNLVIAHRSQVN